MTSDEHMRF